MAFPTGQNFYRTPIRTALVTPVSTGSATSTVRFAHALVLPRIYTDNLGAVNYDTDTDIATGVYATNEVATSGQYTTALSAGSAGSGTWSTTPTLVQGSTAGGTNIVHGPAGINMTYTGVTWAGASGGFGCILYDNSASLTTRSPIASFRFGSSLTPTAGTVTLTWTNGFLTFG